jgi:hypothetical protein
MITGKTKTEAMYRAVNLDSSSSLKEFSVNRRKYYKKYVLGESVEDEENKAINMGRLVETLLMEPEEFDNRFYMSACASIPTANMLNFVEALYKETVAATDEDGNVTKPFEDMCKEAFAQSGYSGKGNGSYESVIKKFVGSDAEIYYNEIRKVRSNGLTVVTTEEITTAENIVNELRSNFATADIVNLVNTNNISVNNQLQIEGYSVEGHLFKSMIDKVIIDHQNKTISPLDLKCTWNVENFYEEYYLYRRAYIQAYLYREACKSLTFTGDLLGYTVECPKFIVCDSTNYYNPLVYVLSEKDMEDAYNGFEHKGRAYPGVKEIIEDLKWAYKNGLWNISRKNYETGGLVPLK